MSNNKLKIFCILLIAGIFLASCGNSEKSPESNATETEIKEKLIQGNVIEQRDIDFDGQHYNWIKYYMDNQGICLLGINTNSDELVIPSSLYGFRISTIGGSKNENSAEDQAHFESGFSKKLLWNTNKEQILKKVMVPEGIEKISNSGFAYLNAGEIILPESLKSIESYGFIGSNIEKVILKGKETSLEFCSFTNSSFKEIIFPDNYHGNLDTCCFTRSTIEKIKCPDNITKIDYFFQNCKDLKEITFSEKQHELTIPTCAFSGCSSLKTLTFPSTMHKVRIMPSLYADDQKKKGVETLIFQGKNTELQCINEDGSEISNYIPAGKIIAPKNSKAIKKAKKVKKIATFTSLGKKLMTKDTEFLYRNPNFYKTKKYVKLIPMEYEET